MICARPFWNLNYLAIDYVFTKKIIVWAQLGPQHIILSLTLEDEFLCSETSGMTMASTTVAFC